MRKRAPLVVIDDEAQLNSLASTVRLDLVDILQALGEASVPELAVQLGRPADGLYYHLRALADAGLVKTVGEQRKGRAAEAVYAVQPSDRRLAISHRPKSRRAQEAVQKIVHLMLLAAEREYRDASEDPDCVVEGNGRELWPSRAVGWLSRKELVRVNSLLTELNSLISTQRSGSDQKLYALQFSLAPLARGNTPNPKDQP
jgi:DNA-binding PadR family transcriptional regulator